MSTNASTEAKRTWRTWGYGFRLIQLASGLLLFGVSIALLLRAELGLDPWDVLHQGVARSAGFSFGSVVIATSFLVLALWIPLRQRPGVGTIANAVMVGLVADFTTPLLPAPGHLFEQWIMLCAGVVLTALASATYIGAGLGPGPRDGLMMGLAARGHSIGRVRTAIELTVLLAGWLLGGTVGIGTAVFALAIGPLIQIMLPWLDRTGPAAALALVTPADTPGRATGVPG